MNGQLQKIKTNRRIYDLDLTMMYQMCALGRFEARLQDVESSGEDFTRLIDILSDQQQSSISHHGSKITDEEANKIYQNAEDLEDHYDILLDYLQQQHPEQQWKHWQTAVGVGVSNVLPLIARVLKHFHHNGVTFSQYSNHRGNATIQFFSHDHQQKLTGFIETIYQIAVNGVSYIYMFVRPHQALPPEDAQRSPFLTRPRLNTTVVDALPPDYTIIIEPDHIITHAIAYQRPQGTFGIRRDMLVINSSLDRRQR
ncbi:hypothetical protein V5O48_019236 [Marasmius crinis-equi]|uniref:Uncharacterized protein n=1 Tax=Marasmius crinis-equi TaxID=585013 RepID=A0ABR3EIZ0_9AGAR